MASGGEVAKASLAECGSVIFLIRKCVRQPTQKKTLRVFVANYAVKPEATGLRECLPFGYLSHFWSNFARSSL